MKPYFSVLFAVLFCSCSNGTNPKAGVVVDTTLPPAKEIKRSYSSVSTTACDQTKLSNQFELRVKLNRYTDTVAHYDSCSLKVLVADKKTRNVADSISIISPDYFHNTFSDCGDAMSFSTGVKAHRRIVDGYYGDIVVADLNFDGKDDIAIIAAIGSNMGAVYNYYIQKANLRFEMDRFLTDTITYFPTKIDKGRRELTTYLHEKRIYRYDTTTSTWR